MQRPLLQLILLACCADVEDSYLSDHTRNSQKGVASYIQMRLNSTVGCEVFKDSQ